MVVKTLARYIYIKEPVESTYECGRQAKVQSYRPWTKCSFDHIMHFIKLLFNFSWMFNIFRINNKAKCN